ncbi:zinc finger protein 136-like isoform X2 [Peromyscus leucopus]|uniref:zinc finger protein 136-like isoform X2 n=1 Tax=Peromyscus leucopus TaxID=10041 RepID=UPI001884B9D8|nr:zinc finger protein 136-like isoform X2 [Peromyscus leucopus]
MDPSQKNLYKDVMWETYRNLTAVGYSWEDHDIEEHCQSSGRLRSWPLGPQRYRITMKVAWQQVSNMAAKRGRYPIDTSSGSTSF